MRQRALSIGLAVAVSVACGLVGPNPSFDGEWMAPAGKGYAIGLSLRQSGDTITGTACAAQDGHVLYANAPVTGDYPSIRVTVTPQSTACCPWLAGQTYTAKMEDRGEIVTPEGIRFRRGSAALCP